ncbi:MAG: hypothetical protein P8Y07_09440, partial [Gemmatimonadales bacterium]
MMALTPTQVVELYGRRAKRYDLTANLYYLIGFREQAYRRRAVDSVVQSGFVDAGLTALLAATLLLSCGVQPDRADL